MKKRQIEEETVDSMTTFLQISVPEMATRTVFGGARYPSNQLKNSDLRNRYSFPYPTWPLLMKKLLTRSRSHAMFKKSILTLGAFCRSQQVFVAPERHPPSGDPGFLVTRQPTGEEGQMTHFG
jgi:hypothetical protein